MASIQNDVIHRIQKTVENPPMETTYQSRMAEAVEKIGGPTRAAKLLSERLKKTVWPSAIQNLVKVQPGRDKAATYSQYTPHVALLSGYRLEYLATGQGEKYESAQDEAERRDDGIEGRRMDVSATVAPLIEQIQRMDREGTLPDELTSSLSSMLNSFERLSRKPVSDKRRAAAQTALDESKREDAGDMDFRIGPARAQKR